jgi:ankyrin repeat protein
MIVTVETLFHKAARNGDIVFIKQLHKDGIDINCVDAYKKTALMYAVQSNSFETVKFLVDNKADLDLCDFEQCSALSLAILYSNYNEKIQMIKYLVEHGAKINDNIITILIQFYVNNMFNELDLKIFDYLISKGCVIQDKVKDTFSNTILPLLRRKKLEKILGNMKIL